MKFGSKHLAVLEEKKSENDDGWQTDGRRTGDEGRRRLSTLYPYTRPRGYKTFFMLNSVEHEILNAPKYTKFQEIRLF